MNPKPDHRLLSIEIKQLWPFGLLTAEFLIYWLFVAVSFDLGKIVMFMLMTYGSWLLFVGMTLFHGYTLVFRSDSKNRSILQIIVLLFSSIILVPMVWLLAIAVDFPFAK